MDLEERFEGGGGRKLVRSWEKWKAFYENPARKKVKNFAEKLSNIQCCQKSNIDKCYKPLQKCKISLPKMVNLFYKNVKFYNVYLYCQKSNIAKKATFVIKKATF